MDGRFAAMQAQQTQQRHANQSSKDSQKRVSIRWDQRDKEEERVVDEDGVNMKLSPQKENFLASLENNDTGTEGQSLLDRLDMCAEVKRNARSRFNSDGESVDNGEEVSPGKDADQSAADVFDMDDEDIDSMASEGIGSVDLSAVNSQVGLGSDQADGGGGEVGGGDVGEGSHEFKGWDAASACGGGKAGSVGTIESHDMDTADMNACARFCAKIPVLSPIGWFRSYWDWFVIVLVLYVAVMVPMQACFLAQLENWLVCKPIVGEDGNVTEKEGLWSVLYKPFALFVVEQFDEFVDVVFMVDLVLNFNTGYQDKYGNIVRNRRDIAHTYARGFFFVDLVSSIPFDKFIQGDNVGAVSVLKCIRLLRLGRLMKKLDQMENANAFRVVKLMLSFTLITHWVACLWFLFGNIGAEPAPEGSDVEMLSWVWTIRSEFTPCMPRQFSLGYWYMLSFYWALTTLTTVGYGDITPISQAEYWFTICVEWAGNVVSAVIVGNVAVLLGAYEAAYQRYRDRIETLNGFTQIHDLPKELSKRMLVSMDYFFQKSQGLDYQGMLSRVSPALKAEVLMVMYGECISSTNLFEDAPEAVVKAIALKVSPVEYYTDDYVVRAGDPGTHLFIILSGRVQIVPKNDTRSRSSRAKLESGALFGEMPVFSGKPHLTHIRCTEPCELLLLSKYDLEDLLVDFPDFMTIFKDRVKNKMRYLRHMRTAGQAPPEMLELHGIESPEFRKSDHEHGAKGSPTVQSNKSTQEIGAELTVADGMPIPIDILGPPDGEDDVGLPYLQNGSSSRTGASPKVGGSGRGGSAYGLTAGRRHSASSNVRPLLSQLGIDEEGSVRRGRTSAPAPEDEPGEGSSSSHDDRKDSSGRSLKKSASSGGVLHD